MHIQANFWAFFFVLFLGMSCQMETPMADKSQPKNDKVPLDIFQSFVDSALVNGSILIFDADSQVYYSNDFNWADSGHIPASTFKIPNSIIGLETGVVSSDTTLFIWDGKPRRLKTWEADLTFTQAFHKSCVPCYQEVARNIGANNMRQYLDTFNYGNIIFDTISIDQFWLEGASTISQFQQIDFLARFYNQELPISAHTQSVMEKMMIISSDSVSQLSGKTGWSVNGEANNGWFVGQLLKNGRTLYFATNVSPKPEMDLDNFSAARKVITHKAIDYVIETH